MKVMKEPGGPPTLLEFIGILAIGIGTVLLLGVIIGTAGEVRDLQSRVTWLENNRVDTIKLYTTQSGTCGAGK